MLNKIRIHHLYCQRFIFNLERSQETLLHLKQMESAFDFELLYSCFLSECKKMLNLLSATEADSKSYLLHKQLHRICRYLVEFDNIIKELKKSKLSVKEIIVHFEKQHSFKKVLKKHLEDLEDYLTTLDSIRQEKDFAS